MMTERRVPKSISVTRKKKIGTFSKRTSFLCSDKNDTMKTHV